MSEKENPSETNKKGIKRHGSQAINIQGGSDKDESQLALPPWVAGGSPAKFYTHEDIINMSAELENLELVHEIAIDPNFQIPDMPVDPVEKCVRENMHRAYFDLLRNDLAKDPPEYDHCFGFIMEIKNMILEDILTAQHVRLRAELSSSLDEKSLRERLKNENVSINEVMKYILNLCSRLCAPDRDSIVDELKKKKDVIDLFKGTMELLELMKNDLTNYQISQSRAEIEDYSSKHEYKVFQKKLAENPNGCDLTKQWLFNAFDEIYNSAEVPNVKKEKKDEIEESDEMLVQTTSRAYTKLVKTEKPKPFPETMEIDKNRLLAMAEKFTQMVFCASSVFVTCNIAGKEISESESFKKTLKDHLISISNRIEEKCLQSDLEKIAEQCVKESKSAAEKLKITWDEDKSKLMKNQINSLIKIENPIRTLVSNRISTFIEEILKKPTTVPHRLLPGLSVIQSELCAFTAKFLRLCVHNRKTFNELYLSMILEFQVDKNGIPHDRSFFREPSPSEPGPSTSGIN